MHSYVKCNLCGANDYRVIYLPGRGCSLSENRTSDYLATTVDYGIFNRIVKCKRCGLVYLNPREEEKKILDQYTGSIDEVYLKEILSRRKNAIRCLNKISHYKRIDGLKILDIGCLIGLLLKEAQKKDSKVYGVELSRWAIKYAKEQFGLNIFNGTLEEAAFEDNYFDVVILNDTLEHLCNPYQSLLEINRILKKDGLLYLNTPDINSFVARLFGKRWWCFRKSHLYYFSRETLKKILLKTGFYVLRMSSYGRSFTLDYWASKPRFFGSIPYKTVMSIINLLRVNKKEIYLNLGCEVEVLANKVR